MKCGEVSSVGVEMFQRGVDFKIRDGSRVRFWLAEWVRVGLLCLSFFRLFRVVLNKRPSLRECFVGEEGFVSLYVLGDFCMSQRSPSMRPFLVFFLTF